MSEKHETKFLLLGGARRETSKTFEVRSPYSGDLIARVSNAGQSEIEKSIAAAQRSYLRPPSILFGLANLRSAPPELKIGKLNSPKQSRWNPPNR